MMSQCERMRLLTIGGLPPNVFAHSRAVPVHITEIDISFVHATRVHSLDVDPPLKERIKNI